jgi:hypothetical protein
MKKLLVLVAGGVGYVLGTKAGRERYEQIRGTFNKVKSDPRVQEKAQQAADLAKEKAPVVKEKAQQAAHQATEKAGAKVGSSNGTTAAPAGGVADQLNPESTVFQESPGPKGDLP